MRSPSTYTVPGYARILLRGWVLVLCAAVAGGLAGWLAAYTTPKTYESQARLLIVAPGSASVSGAFTSGLAGKLRAPSYQQIATGDQVLQRVATNQWPGIAAESTPAELRERLTVTINPSDAVLRITATGDSPIAAQQLSTATATELSKLVPEVDWLAGRTPYELKVVDVASAQDNAVAPKPLTYVGLGAAIGFVMAAIAVLALAIAGNRILGPHDASEVLESVLHQENSR